MNDNGTYVSKRSKDQLLEGLRHQQNAIDYEIQFESKKNPVSQGKIFGMELIYSQMLVYLKGAGILTEEEWRMLRLRAQKNSD